MKIERIRKNHKKKMLIGVVIVLALVSTITLTMSKSKYRLTQSVKLVTGTINYKVPDMRIVAVNISEDGTNYEIANEIPESGYILNEEKSLCRVYDGTTSVAEAPKDTSITIEYIEGKLNIRGVSKRNTRCYLYFDKYEPPITISDIIASFGSRLKTGDPDFTLIAEGTETEENNGIYKTADPMYGENAKTYYWRGAATTNHVIFADKCWRIIRINGDNSMRLIYNGVVSNNTCPGNGSNSGSIAITSQEYNANNNRSEYVGYTYTEGSQRPIDNDIGSASNLKMQTEDWLDKNITGANLNKIDLQGKYCNDRTIGSGTWVSTSIGKEFYYASRERLQTNKNPILECDSNDIYMLKVGAITADEISMAGGKMYTDNYSYYLYNGGYYWTMSSYGWSSGTAFVFFVTANGSLSRNSASGPIGIRPVINLRSDVTFNAESDGTQNNPYIVQ